MTPSDTSSPEHISDEIATALEDCSDSQLRELIEYAQQLLRDQPSLTDAIESREGEELLRMENHGAYTFVVVERPDETGEGRGPFAYMVKREPTIDDEGDQYKWHYLGKVHGDTGDD